MDDGGWSQLQRSQVPEANGKEESIWLAGSSGTNTQLTGREKATDGARSH